MKHIIFILIGSVFLLVFYWQIDLGNESDLQAEQALDDNSQTFVSSQIIPIELPKGSRKVSQSTSVILPVPGSVPTESVQHTVAIEDIRRGCFRQDCIPSIDNPEFVSATEADSVLAVDSIGIALSYKGEERFYPFPMLETHELVNDTVAGDALLISYCPLCGTGIVFDRTLNGVAVEFGVSGMLWNSNLLMYNRADNLADQNLWSQVLGEAVVGNRVGDQLIVIPSDIMRFSDWQNQNPTGQVLVTGVPRDPYNGDYYGVARNFAPNFDEATTPIAPDTYVYGLIINGTPVAYPRSALPTGVTTHTVDDVDVTIIVNDTRVIFTDTDENVIPDVEGFWFSWVAAHPDTVLWSS